MEHSSKQWQSRKAQFDELVKQLQADRYNMQLIPAVYELGEDLGLIGPVS